MSSKRSDLGKQGYTSKKGGHGQGRPFGQGQHEKSIGAIRQALGLPYFPAPPRGFRPSDAGKDVFPNRGEPASRG